MLAICHSLYPDAGYRSLKVMLHLMVVLKFSTLDELSYFDPLSKMDHLK